MAKERKSFFGATEELEKLQDELFGAVSVTEETLIDISKLNDFHSGPLGGQPYRIDEEALSFKELTESIESGGIAEPLIVRKDNTQSGCYEIISGHRRKAAALKCGIDKLPCVVRNIQTMRPISLWRTEISTEHQKKYIRQKKHGHTE